MSATLIAKNKCQLNKSYGSVQTASINYIVKVPYSTVSSSVPIYAVSEAMLADGVPRFGEPVDALTPLYAVEHKGTISSFDSDNWYVDVNIDFLAAHKMENNYLITMRTSMTTENTNRDITGALLTCDYTYPGDLVPTYQTGNVQVQRPSVEICAIGLSKTNNPMSIVAGWMGYINTDTFAGMNPQTLLCTQCNYELHNMLSTPETYKFQFSFTGTTESWYPIYWFKDGTTGEAPVDLVWGNGIKQAFVYRGMPYNDAFPFNGAEQYIA